MPFNNAAERSLRGDRHRQTELDLLRLRCGWQPRRRHLHLIETAKLNGVDPQAWLADVLARLPDHPVKSLDELLPWNWKASRPPQSWPRRPDAAPTRSAGPPSRGNPDLRGWPDAYD